MALNPTEAVAFCGFFAFVFVQVSGGGSAQRQQTSEALGKRSWFARNAYVFGWVWLLLYVLITFTMFVWWRDASSAIERGFALLIVNVVLNKLWTPVFFNRYVNAWPVLRALALLIALALLGTAVWFTIHAFVFNVPLAGALFLPYDAWLVVAIYLNVRALRQPSASINTSRRTRLRRPM